MLFPISSGRYIYRPLKEGLSGWDVLALQQALRAVGATITVDGIFGPLTKAAVLALQRSESLKVDAIAGTQTQTAIVLDAIWPQQGKYGTPPGLARGMVEGESNFIVGNYTKLRDNGTRDVGLVMFNITPTDASLKRAFDPAYALDRLCHRLRSGEPGAPYGHDNFFGKPGAKTHEAAWRLAVLAWNWPAAAVTLANGGKLSTAPAAWVIEQGVDGVTSPADWAEHYVESKIAYVDNWPA